jgi:hypothetical protein
VDLLVKVFTRLVPFVVGVLAHGGELELGEEMSEDRLVKVLSLSALSLSLYLSPLSLSLSLSREVALVPFEGPQRASRGYAHDVFANDCYQADVCSENRSQCTSFRSNTRMVYLHCGQPCVRPNSFLQ